MKCFALMIHDDGTAMVGECSPEVGEEMMAAGQMQDVSSVEEGLSRLAEMAAPAAGEETQAADETAMSRGFKKAKGPQAGYMGAKG